MFRFSFYYRNSRVFSSPSWAKSSQRRCPSIRPYMERMPPPSDCCAMTPDLPPVTLEMKAWMESHHAGSFLVANRIWQWPAVTSHKYTMFLITTRRKWSSPLTPPQLNLNKYKEHMRARENLKGYLNYLIIARKYICFLMSLVMHVQQRQCSWVTRILSDSALRNLNHHLYSKFILL